MSTPDPAVRDLLQVIRDALDVSRKDDQRASNAAAVTAALEAVLAHPDLLDDQLTWPATWIREHVTVIDHNQASKERSA
jgi:hypothetical protein